MASLVKALLVAGVSLLPVYINESGQMQLSHLLIGIGALAYFAHQGIRVRTVDLVLAALFALVLAREFVAAVEQRDAWSLLPAGHLLFSAMVFSALVRFTDSAAGSAAMRTGLWCALVVAVGGVLALGYSWRVGDQVERAVGTFNNPNQLGYFAVLMLSVQALLYLRRTISLTAFGAAVIACVFLAAASLSKAALVSVALSACLLGFTMGRGTRSLIFGFLVLGCTVVAGYVAFFGPMAKELAFVQRLHGIGLQADDTLEERGYGVFARATGVEVLFGFGSSGVEDLIGREIHSTIFSVLGAYGLIGLMLFAAVLLLWAGRILRAFGMVGVMVVCLPPMAYGMAHNGIRFTLFWILLAMSFALTRVRARDSLPVRRRWHGATAVR